MTISKIQSQRLADEFEAFTGPRKDFVRQWGAVYGVSSQTIQRHLAKKGHRARSPRDQQSAITDEMVFAIYSIGRTSRRIDNTVTMPVEEAVRIAVSNGMVPEGFSISSWNRRLKECKLTWEDIKRAASYKEIHSEHPNELWETDATTCLIWALDDKGFFKAQEDYSLELAKKAPKKRKVREHLIRYLMVDHWSGTFYFQYVSATGETGADVIAFFQKAIESKDDSRYPFQGVPFHLWADKGGAFDNTTLRSLCGSLDVEFYAHASHAPRAKGMVEQLNNSITRHFESGLALDPPENLVQLNRRAFLWAVRWNADRIFRGTEYRTTLWKTITPEQNRNAPPDHIFKHCVRSEAVERTVPGNLTVSFMGNKYRLPDDGRYAGRKVLVHVNAYDKNSVRIKVFADSKTEETITHVVEPLMKQANGRIYDPATAQKVGEPKATKESPEVKAQKKSESLLEEYGVVYKGSGSARRAFPVKGFDESKRIKVYDDEAPESVPMDIPMAGTNLSITEESMKEPVIERIRAMEKVVAALGRGMTKSERQIIKTEYPLGLTASQIAASVQRFTQQIGHSSSSVIPLHKAVNDNRGN